MANRFDFFFKQVVTEGEIDGAFAGLELADRNVITDLGLSGIASGGIVAEHFPVPDLTVDIAGPLFAHSPLGERLFFAALQNVDVSVDDLSVSTAVGTPGNEKIIAVFLKFDRLLSDDRVDGGGNPIKFQQDESFKFVVKQSAEAPIGTAVPPPLEADGILFVDVTLINAQTQVLNADLDFSRRQELVVVAAGFTPTDDVRSKTLSAAQATRLNKGQLTYSAAVISAAGAIVGSNDVNVASIGHPSTGLYNITLDQPHDGINYVAQVTIDGATAGMTAVVVTSASIVTVRTFDDAGVLTDLPFHFSTTGA